MLVVHANPANVVSGRGYLDLVIKMTEKDKEEHIKQLVAEATALPGLNLTEKEIRKIVHLPDEVRLGDNPYFQAFEKQRKAKEASRSQK